MTEKMTNAEVTVTLTVNGKTETFTGSAQTGGDPFSAARAIAYSVTSDACKWTQDLATEAERRARRDRWAA